VKPKSILILSVLLACICMTAFPGDAECQESRQPDKPAVWTVPDCDYVSGTNAVTFTTDEGLSVAETSVLRQPFHTRGLAALDVANTLVAGVAMDSDAVVLRSEDAGCQWKKIAEIRDTASLVFTAGPGGTVYAWSAGRLDFYRIEGKDVTALTAPDEIYGVAVDPADALHLRIGGRDCQLYESLDGGAGFSSVGNPAGTANYIFFTVDFHPLNWNQALCGTSGAWRTTDGGESWSTISPFVKEYGDIVYRFAYSPADPQRVWARGKLNPMGLGPKGIFVSDDGGASFSLAAAEGTVVSDQYGIDRTLLLPSIPTMAAHPENSDVVYFATSNAFDNYGTDLYRYEMNADYLSVIHIDNLDSLDAVAFNPADPSVMYLGVAQIVVSLKD